MVKGDNIYQLFGIEKLLPVELCPDIRPDACHHPTLYINMAGGIKTSLHFDRSQTSFTAAEMNNFRNRQQIQVDPGKNNIFVELTGSRTFYLFSPDFSEEMMVTFREGHLNHISQATTFLHSVLEHSPDFNEQLMFIKRSSFPQFTKAWANRVEITLHAGDALLIPARWWHYTLLHEPGMALNWWFLRDCLRKA